MALPRKPKPDGSLVLWRLDLDAELATQLTAAADQAERTLPGQIRIALREWLAAHPTEEITG